MGLDWICTVCGAKYYGKGAAVGCHGHTKRKDLIEEEENDGKN